MDDIIPNESMAIGSNTSKATVYSNADIFQSWTNDNDWDPRY